MARRDVATQAKQAAFDYLQRKVGVRPSAVGLTRRGEGEYGLRVSFPSAPQEMPPDPLMEVPVEYLIGGEPMLLAAAAPARRKSRMG